MAIASNRQSHTTEPAASDNKSRMRLIVIYEKVLLLYGLRNMERYSVFAWQVYMDLVRR